MKKFFLFTIIFLSGCFFLNGCKKNSIDIQNPEPVHSLLPDLTTQVNALVEGFITDEQGNPVESAVIKAGNGATATDEFGYFMINNTGFAKSQQSPYFQLYIQYKKAFVI